MLENIHGGADAQGIPAHDFSTNRNACGPCPAVVAALRAADWAQYPDPGYVALRAQLAQFHGVTCDRVIIAGSSSEFIHRITAHAVRCGASCVTLPAHHYGDYLQAAKIWGLTQQPRQSVDADAALLPSGLHWACEPSSPLGSAEDIWHVWQATAMPTARHWLVWDCAYMPLRLDACTSRDIPDTAWQLWTPNKALGMTGIRAAYAIAPQHVHVQELQALRALAPSWVIGAHGVAMLQAWTTSDVQQWLAGSLHILHDWKVQQLALCAALGWQVLPGHLANYMVVQWLAPQQKFAMRQTLDYLRKQGIKLRDCASFGLPGCVRLGVLPPVSQQILRAAWQQWIIEDANS